MRLQLLFIILALTVVASVRVIRVAQEVELLNVPCGSVLHTLPEGTEVSKVGASRLTRCDGVWEARTWLPVEFENVQGWISEEEANGLVRDDRYNGGDGDGGDGNQGDGNNGDGNNYGDGNQGDGNNGDGNNGDGNNGDGNQGD